MCRDAPRLISIYIDCLSGAAQDPIRKSALDNAAEVALSCQRMRR
jgi:hypothetical protein